MSSHLHLRFNKKSLSNVALPSPGNRATFHDIEVPGLQLRVTDRGVKSFCVFRRSRRGAPERITIGRFPTLSVEHARVQARRYLADLGQGISIAARQRNQTLAARTLDDVHRDYLSSRGVTIVVAARKDGTPIEKAELGPNAKLKASTARDYVKAMAQKFADWRAKPMTSITRDMVEARHLALTERSPAEANRAMRYLRALFVFASDYRDSAGQPVIPDNPVRRLSAKRLWNRIERRTRYIEPNQLSAWWAAVQSLKNQPQYPSREVLRDYLLVLLFTGLRRNEALCLRWENIHLQRGTLRVVDTKNRSDHVLPMGSYLLDLMRRRRLASRSEWVFPNPRGRSLCCAPCAGTSYDAGHPQLQSVPMQTAQKIPWSVRMAAPQRLAIVVAGSGVIFSVQPSTFPVSNRLLLSWDLGALAYLALAWMTIVRADSAMTHIRARFYDQKGYVIFLLVITAACASMVAIGFVMGEIKQVSAWSKAVNLTLSISALFLSWMLIHTLFAFLCA